MALLLAAVVATWLGVVRPPALAAEVGGVLSWGPNFYNQLGNDQAPKPYSPTPGDVALPPGTTVTDVAAGESHSLALTSDGQVLTWGGENRPAAVTSVPMPAGTEVTDIAAGAEHNLALTRQGQVLAWGVNRFGQLGYDESTSSPEYRPTPVAVALPAGTTIKAVDAGAYHSLALTRDGKEVWAWGANEGGQLGNGTTGNISPLPVAAAVPVGITVTAVAGGNAHSLAVTSTGSLLGWGHNGFGQLGDGTFISHHVPTPSSVVGVVTIAAGAYHSLALVQGGEVLAWGFNQSGQLGDGTNGEYPLHRRSVPSRVLLPPGTTATAVFAGAGHGLALGSDARLFSWGFNSQGQLGDGTTEFRYTPVRVGLPAGVTIAALDSGGSADEPFAGGDSTWGGTLGGGHSLAIVRAITPTTTTSTTTTTSSTTTTTTAVAPTVRVANASITEPDAGTAPLSFAVTLSPPAAGIVSVAFATKDGSAVLGGDYQARNDILVFSPGQERKEIVVPVVGDTTPESTENFYVSMSNPVGGELGTSRAEGRILDDDVPAEEKEEEKKEEIGGSPDEKGGPVTERTPIQNTPVQDPSASGAPGGQAAAPQTQAQPQTQVAGAGQGGSPGASAAPASQAAAPQAQSQTQLSGAGQGGPPGPLSPETGAQAQAQQAQAQQAQAQQAQAQQAQAQQAQAQQAQAQQAQAQQAQAQQAQAQQAQAQQAQAQQAQQAQAQHHLLGQQQGSPGIAQRERQFELQTELATEGDGWLASAHRPTPPLPALALAGGAALGMLWIGVAGQRRRQDADCALVIAHDDGPRQVPAKPWRPPAYWQQPQGGR